MNRKYKMQSWKLTIEGQYPNDEQAIKFLADKYLSCSKCDPPSESLPELLAKQDSELQFFGLSAINAECLLDTISGKEPVPAIGATTSFITKRTEENIAKSVALYVEEVVHGISQWVLKYKLAIYPFKPEHWWKSDYGFTPQIKEFHYEIINK